MSQTDNRPLAADVAVVGAGPSGQTAAIAAAQRGAEVILCEHLDRPAAKLLVTGGGRCNLTNTLSRGEFMRAFGHHGRFMDPALRKMDSRALCEFFAGLGVQTYSPDGLHVFPSSNSAASLQQALQRRLDELGIRRLLGAEVTGLWIEGGSLRGLETRHGRVAAPAVVLATGGKSYPDLGATGSGYNLAQQAGHTVATPTPALVGLVTLESWPRRCAGIGLPQARVWIDLRRQSKAGVSGEILFTHRGISGPAVLDLSGDVAALLMKHSAVPVRVDLSPGISAQQWLERFDQWRQGQGGKGVRSLLGQYLPSALAQIVCDLALGPRPPDSPAVVAAAMTRQQAKATASLLTAMPLTVPGTEGFGKAMITRGGVSLRQVDPRTLESKLLPRLFFAGELLDLDGPCGGFNLQWAFASGNLAGLSAAGKQQKTEPQDFS